MNEQNWIDKLQETVVKCGGQINPTYQTKLYNDGWVAWVRVSSSQLFTSEGKHGTAELARQSAAQVAYPYVTEPVSIPVSNDSGPMIVCSHEDGVMTPVFSASPEKYFDCDEITYSLNKSVFPHSRMVRMTIKVPLGAYSVLMTRLLRGIIEMHQDDYHNIQVFLPMSSSSVNYQERLAEVLDQIGIAHMHNLNTITIL